MHHIFIDENQIDEKNIVVSHKDDFLNYNHLRNALRVKAREKVQVSINSETSLKDYICEISKVSEDEIKLTILEECPKNEMTLKINLYQGLPKFDKMEYIIEKTVELGVCKIIPVSMKNCVVKLDDKKSKCKIDRWNKISLSAATQSKRGIVPIVEDVIDFDSMIDKLKNEKNTYLLYEDAKASTKAEFNNINKIKDEINFIVGPEGGFNPIEIEKAKNAGIKFLTLGERILRTETAPLAFLSYVMLNYELNN
jgi:16S rRNA (uracil1498-N3)-methyltransferase